jgi:uncharacterized membrane protein YfcA
MILSIILFRKNHNHKLENGCDPILNNEENNITNSKLNDKLNLGVNNPVIASFSSFAGGFVSGLGGVGGGTADTTTMILLGLDPKKAAATSQFAMVFTSVFGVIVHILFRTYTGIFIWPAIMTLGAIIGAQVGVSLCSKIHSNIIRKLLAVLAFYTGILLILLMFNIGW